MQTLASLSPPPNPAHAQREAYYRQLRLERVRRLQARAVFVTVGTTAALVLVLLATLGVLGSM